VLSERPLSREGTAALLERPGWRVTECGSLSQLSAAARAHALDVVVVDADAVSADLYTYVRNVRSVVNGDGRIVVMGSPMRYAAIDLDVASADGNAASLVAAVSTEKKKRARASSWSSLTPRQRDVLRWLANGLDNKAIGRRLGIGERAVKAHVTALLALFELDNRTQLALLAHQAGYRPSTSVGAKRRVA